MAARMILYFLDTEHNSDADLIRRISNNDESGLAVFYKCYRTILFGLLVHILNNRAEAEYVLQEVFVQVWRQAKNFDGEWGSDNWL